MDFGKEVSRNARYMTKEQSVEDCDTSQGRPLGSL